MPNQFWMFVVVLGFGLVLAVAYWIWVRPGKPWQLLVPLVVPAIVWLALGGALTSLKFTDQFEINFAQAANAAVGGLVDTSAVSIDETTETEPVPIMEQRPIEADPSTATLYSGLGAVAVTVGERSGRVFLWYLYEGLDPAALRQTLLDEAPRLTFDVAREYLMFGPEIGRIDCYIPSDDLVLRRDDVQQMLRVLPTLPQSDWGRSLRESGVCRPPLAQDVSAMDALSVLSTAGHDEGIVVRDSGTYVGLIFRDQIVTHLLRSLSESGGS